jgi:hypothetical protein
MKEKIVKQVVIIILSKGQSYYLGLNGMFVQREIFLFRVKWYILLSSRVGTTDIRQGCCFVET